MYSDNCDVTYNMDFCIYFVFIYYFTLIVQLSIHVVSIVSLRLLFNLNFENCSLLFFNIVILLKMIMNFLHFMGNYFIGWFNYLISYLIIH